MWLAVYEVAGRATINLNGHPLGTIVGHGAEDEFLGQRCPTRFDVTALLQPRNVLVVDVISDAQTSATSAADYPGLVQLEIE